MQLPCALLLTRAVPQTCRTFHSFHCGGNFDFLHDFLFRFLHDFSCLFHQVHLLLLVLPLAALFVPFCSPFDAQKHVLAPKIPNRLNNGWNVHLHRAVENSLSPTKCNKVMSKEAHFEENQLK
jgi:hypothetical protein